MPGTYPFVAITRSLAPSSPYTASVEMPRLGCKTQAGHQGRRGTEPPKASATRLRTGAETKHAKSTGQRAEGHRRRVTR